MIEVDPEDLSIDADSGCRIGLRIAVHKEGLSLSRSQGSCKIDCRSGLPYPPFLIGYAYDPQWEPSLSGDLMEPGCLHKPPSVG